MGGVKRESPPHEFGWFSIAVIAANGNRYRLRVVLGQLWQLALTLNHPLMSRVMNRTVSNRSLEAPRLLVMPS